MGCPAHSVEHKWCMENAENAEVAAYIGRWRPSSVSPDAAAFARDVITKTGPEGRGRAKNLLWAAGKLAGYAASLGLDLGPAIGFPPSVIERLARRPPAPAGAARPPPPTRQRVL